MLENGILFGERKWADEPDRIEGADLYSRRSLTPVLAAAALVALLAWPCVANAATVRTQDDDARIRYFGSTRAVTTPAASAYGRRTLPPGSSVEASFTGTSVGWVGARNPRLGEARVFVDGSQVATVSAYGSRHVERAALWSLGGLVDGTHSLRIEAVGSTTLDALDLTGALVEPSRPHPVVRVQEGNTLVAFSDFFRTVPSSTGGALRYSKVPGASVAVAFDGTDIAWLGLRSRSGGRARVYLDGKDQGVVSLKSSVTRGQRVIFSRAGLSDGPHTLQVIVIGGVVSFDAFDVAGTPEQAWRRVEDNDRRIRYGGPWRTLPGWEGSSQTISGRAGAVASVSFNGRSAAVRGVVGRTGGKADVYVDGAKVDTIDFYASSAKRNVTLWSSSSLGAGAHTLSVRVLGTKSGASEGTTVGLDALEIGGAVVVPGTSSGHSRGDAAGPAFARVGAWASDRTIAAAGGSSLASARKGSKFYMEFTGTGFTWAGTRSTHGGRAKVTVDGKVRATVSLYSAQSQDQRAIFRLTGLTNKRHKVVIEVLGRTSPRAEVTRSASTGSTWSGSSTGRIGPCRSSTRGPRTS